MEQWRLQFVLYLMEDKHLDYKFNAVPSSFFFSRPIGRREFTYFRQQLFNLHRHGVKHPVLARVV